MTSPPSVVNKPLLMIGRRPCFHSERPEITSMVVLDDQGMMKRK
jgi:hypothetical protein